MRSRRMPYLEVRPTGFYFRLQFPSPLRAILGRANIRVSLSTSELSIARERVSLALPHVYSLKRLLRKGGKMTPEEYQRALRYAISRIVETLETAREPWLPEDDQTPDDAHGALLEHALGFRPSERATRLMQSWVAGVDIEGDEIGNVARATVMDCGGSAAARSVLSTLNIDVDEGSDLFRDLSLEMGKVTVALRLALVARSKGDYSAEARLVNYYRRSGYVQSASESAAATTPTISEAWKAYATEKTGGPKPAWTAKTALKQEATFRDWRDIIGDVRVGELTRDMMLRFRDALARLPSNRHKRYPGKSIAALLAVEIPPGELPAHRTVLEKLVQVGTFLRWCRETKQYLSVDPMAGLYFDADSKSYAPFSVDDLKRMFNGHKYENGKHRKSWQFWTPLIALYSGARQTEIAQLAVTDIIQEDGVWYLSITDAGEDQHVKTRAAVRKVPINSKLVELGFLHYVACLKARGEQRLFPDLDKGPNGWGDKVSRWFGNTFSKGAGIQDDPSGRQKVFHSFRHNAITQALGAQVSIAHAQQVFGHEQSLLGETATYMGEFPIKKLVPVIEALDYGLDHTAYNDAWRKYVEQWPGQSEANDCQHSKRAA